MKQCLGTLRILTFACCAMGCAAAVHASESRGFVVTWFTPAMNSQDGDCGPGGINPRGNQLFETIVKDLNLSPGEVAKALEGYPDNYAQIATERGRIDGKPVNVYLNPTSVPDPLIKTSLGKKGYGFNLDGKDGPNDFVEIETGEKGVDNMLSRVTGCFESMRGSPTSRPSYPQGHWSQPTGQMQAWVIEVSAVDDWQNDSSVNVGIYRARDPIVRSLTSEPQPDMTFTIDENPTSWNEMRGHIKDGVLYTDPIEFKMVGDPYYISYYRFKSARLRMRISADGNVQAILGGYFDWLPLYMNFALGGADAEPTLSVNVPGMYYALRRFAEVDPDPRTGINMGISAAYRIEAAPAFLMHQKPRSAETQSASSRQ